jgi:hypothetical protein
MPRNTAGLRRGGPGRPKGSKNKVPGTVKAAIQEACFQVGKDDLKLVRAALEKGIQADPPKSHPYLLTFFHYVLGKPADTLTLKGDVQLPQIVNHFHVESGDVDGDRGDD